MRAWMVWEGNAEFRRMMIIRADSEERARAIYTEEAVKELVTELAFPVTSQVNCDAIEDVEGVHYFGVEDLREFEFGEDTCLIAEE